MLIEIFFGGGLMLTIAVIALVVLTVTIHALGFDLLIRALLWTRTLDASGFQRVTFATIGLACGLMLIHLVEIAVWAFFYLWQGCLPDAESALYHIRN